MVKSAYQLPTLVYGKLSLPKKSSMAKLTQQILIGNKQKIFKKGRRLMKIHQGDIIWLDLEPARGTETKKTCPCLIVSNDDYNRIFNTVITVPISMASKYESEEKYRNLPMFVQIAQDKIHGTALLQHARAVDLAKRIDSKVEATLPPGKMREISTILSQFY